MLPFALVAEGSVDFDAGAELRVRQELFDNAPGLPGGGVQSTAKACDYRNQMRFRVRAWAESRFEGAWGKFRLRARVADEFRHFIHTSSDKYKWPDEVILDNLFLEGRGLLDGFLDFQVGRQDLVGLYGLDHIFDDGTPADFSRSFYGDIARFTLNVSDDSKLDFFGIYDEDENVLRWGNEESRRRSLTGYGGGAEPEMDDWGFGVIWGSKLAKDLPYQLFVMQKNTREFERNGVMHPWTQRELIGAKSVPQLNEEWSVTLEAMGQVGCNGDGATLSGWSGSAGLNWKSARAGVRPFSGLVYQFMSGDDDAVDEDGGHSAWDPMWARGIRESILFCYGTHYGYGYWSNMHYTKLVCGLDFGRHHRLACHTGPMFAAAQDGLGGDEGMFKGLLSQARYEFPLWLPDLKKGERLEIFGHLLAELFNPGDYYAADKPAWFLRWQVEVKF